ncbi:MAG: hypothetical protein QW390_02495 [Candidatus Bathyarchaeia archaeon]
MTLLVLIVSLNSLGRPETIGAEHGFIFSCSPWASDNAKHLRQELGADWANLDFWWTEIEYVQGRFNYGSSEGQINYVKSSYPGTKIIGSIMGIVPPYPGWWWSPMKDPPDWSFYRSAVTNSTAFREYKSQVYEFVFTFVSHHKDDVEIWVTTRELSYLDRFQLYRNNIAEKQSLGRIDQAVALHKVIARAIRDADPDAFVVLGAAAPRGVDTAAYVDTRTLVESCLLSNVTFDAVGFEVAPWTGLDAEEFDEYMKNMSIFNKRLFPFLVGYPSSYKGDSTYWSSRTFDEDAQAEWLRAILLSCFNNKNLLGFGYSSFQDSSAQEDEGWGLVTYEGTPKKAYQTYKDLISKYRTESEIQTTSEKMLILNQDTGSLFLTNEANLPSLSIPQHRFLRLGQISWIKSLDL